VGDLFCHLPLLYSNDSFIGCGLVGNLHIFRNWDGTYSLVSIFLCSGSVRVARLLVFIEKRAPIGTQLTHRVRHMFGVTNRFACTVPCGCSICQNVR
jgi:hypothetical protein